MHLAQGNKFPEEKLDSASKLVDHTLETKGEDKQQAASVMQKVGTPTKYPVPFQEPSIQRDASNASVSQATHPAVQAKRDRCRVLLDLLYHFIATRNLAGLY